MKKYITSNDNVRIHYDIQSGKIDGKTAILIHGLGGDLTAWDEVRKKIKQDTIAIDLRGHGRSERPKGAEKYSFERMAQDINEIVEKEKIKEPIIIGHCLGGMVAIQYAVKYKIKSMVLVATSYKAPWYGKMATKVKLPKVILSLTSSYLPLFYSKNKVDYKKYIKTGDYYVPRIVSDIWHTSLRSYAGICKHLAGDLDLTPLLKKIKCRTLVIFGEKDVVFPKNISAEIKMKIKNSEICGINGGHVLVISNSMELSEKINEWIGK